MNSVVDSLLLLQQLELGAPTTAAAPIEAEEVRRKIPPQILLHYDRLRARGKKGVSLVRNGVCSQCHMKLAMGLLAAVHRLDNYHRCESCGSFLRLAEEPPKPLEMPARNLQPTRRGRPRKQTNAV